jgi:hypothetical protein
MLLSSLWIAPIGMYYSGGRQKIMFGTGSCKVFALDPDGGDPDILFTPDDTEVGSCDDDCVPAFALLLEESLVPVGVTMEDMICSSPTTEAWFDILKWLPDTSSFGAEISLQGVARIHHDRLLYPITRYPCELEKEPAD